MEYLKVDAQPGLKSPIAVCAFSGWNDAASAATNAARFIVRRLGARKFATIESEPFYDFKQQRPSVRITARGDREVTWPTNDFFYARNPTGPHDVIPGTCPEPALSSRQFVEAHTPPYRHFSVSLVGSLAASFATLPAWPFKYAPCVPFPTDESIEIACW